MKCNDFDTYASLRRACWRGRVTIGSQFASSVCGSRLSSSRTFYHRGHGPAAPHAPAAAVVCCVHSTAPTTPLPFCSAKLRARRRSSALNVARSNQNPLSGRTTGEHEVAASSAPLASLAERESAPGVCRRNSSRTQPRSARSSHANSAERLRLAIISGRGTSTIRAVGSCAKRVNRRPRKSARGGAGRRRLMLAARLKTFAGRGRA